MADENRSFAPGTVSSNRAQRQGLGVGQEEMDKQLSPSRDAYATDPQRTEPFDESLEPTTNADRPSQADFSGQDVGGAETTRSEMKREMRPASQPPGARLDDRNAAGLSDGGDLGAGTPPAVDVHDLGQKDNPQQEWGEEMDEGATFSSNNTRKGVRTEAERGQGAKTRRMNKDIVSRRT
jgi:hypothetical protein